MTKLSKYVLPCVLALVSVGRAESEHPLGLSKNHPYGRLTADYVTPHVAWAKPYVGGKIRVLVLAPEYSQRETVELAERLSLDFSAWMSIGFSRAVGVHSDWAAAAFLAPAEAAYRSLRESVSREYDAIIVGKLVWSIVPQRERFELLKKVAEGTGLVYVNPPKGDRELEIVFGRKSVPEGRGFIVRNLPLSALPRFQGKDLGALVRTCTFGKGRVVVLDYQEEGPPEGLGRDCAWPCLTPQWDQSDPKEDGFVPLSDLPEMEFVPYEYYQALVARAVLWAAGKENEVQIIRIVLDGTLKWPASDTQAVVEIKGLPERAVVSAVVRDRRRYARTFRLNEKDAKRQTSFALPDVPAGEYFLDVWVRDRQSKKVYTWGSRFFRVDCDFQIGEIKLSGDLINPGEPVSGSIALSRPLAADERIQISLWDNYGRLISSRAPRIEGDRASFRFEPFDVLTICHRIEAQSFRNDRVLASASLDFPIRARLRWDDFNSVVWSGGENQFITHLMLRKLAAEDEADSIDIGWRGATVARDIAAANLSHTPYTARYGCFGPTNENVVRSKQGDASGCMSSPLTLDALKKWGEQQSRIYGPYGPFVWTHGDESNYGHSAPDVCWSETCLNEFRRLVKELYRDVGELNKEWKSSYSSFEKVMPLTFKEAKQNGDYARWVTHRLASDRVFARFYKRTGEALEAHDPGGRGAGFDGGVGLGRPNSGGDWWTLSQSLDLLHSYCHDAQQMEVFRSFARPEQVRGMWYGTYGPTWQIGPSTIAYCHFFPWYSLFHGLNSTWFWTMGSPGFMSGYSPDMTSLPFFEARTEALRRIKSGIGKLLLHSERQNDGIAILFSEASRIAASFYAAKETDWSSSYPEALVNFNKALEDIGFQYEYVSDEEVANGILRQGGFRVLIMAQSRAVSGAEAREIKRFVKDGGILIADITPGVLNGKGTPLEASLLAELFPKDERGATTSFGKGKAILTGDMLAGYGKAHMSQFGWRKLEGRWKLLGDLMEREASLRPAVVATPTVRDEMPPAEITRFRSGENEFVCLLREYFLYDNDPYRVQIAFPREGHVYDVMSGKYLGKRKAIETELSYKAKLYWLSSYRVRSVDLKLPTEARRGEATAVEVVALTDGAAPTGHCFRLEVLSPTGRELRHYARNCLAPKGLARTAIPWALNDLRGLYTVSARDVCSGVTATRTILLK